MLARSLCVAANRCITGIQPFHSNSILRIVLIIAKGVKNFDMSIISNANNILNPKGSSLNDETRTGYIATTSLSTMRVVPEMLMETVDARVNQ